LPRDPLDGRGAKGLPLRLALALLP
jgi:hypothetical protein